MATADTITLSEPHAPKEASIKAFQSIEPTLKQQLVKLRHDRDSEASLQLHFRGLSYPAPPHRCGCATATRKLLHLPLQHLAPKELPISPKDTRTNT
jgi:hypothetical protein